MFGGVRELMWAEALVCLDLFCKHALAGRGEVYTPLRRPQVCEPLGCILGKPESDPPPNLARRRRTEA